jgi:hypothetical protein
MKLFEKFLNAYKKADKKLGGILPGGGTGNVLSNTLKSVNPADVAGLLIPNILGLTASKVHNATQSFLDSGKESVVMKQLPGLMDAASKRLLKAGYPGVYSPSVPGKTIPNETEFERFLNVIKGGSGKYPTKVDISGFHDGLPIKPMFSNPNPNYGVDEPTVFITRTTPSWITAHELGHAVDAAKRPFAYSPPKDIDFADIESLNKLGNRERARKSSPLLLASGLGSLNSDNRSLLDAGIEGALGGLGAKQSILKSEIMADRYGMPIAKEAGVPWNTKQNILAKGTYVLGAVTPGFGQGITAELVNRGGNAILGLTDTALRAFKGDELTQGEASLAKYGYSPSKHKLDFENPNKFSSDIKITERNPAEKYLYEYIRGLR